MVRFSDVGITKISRVLLALSPRVLIQKYLHVAGLDLGLKVSALGSGVVRMDPLRFLARCRTRRLNQV